MRPANIANILYKYVGNRERDAMPSFGNFRRATHLEPPRVSSASSRLALLPSGSWMGLPMSRSSSPARRSRLGSQPSHHREEEIDAPGAMLRLYPPSETKAEPTAK